MPRMDGSVSARVLTMVLVGAFSGALAGLVLASVLANQVWLAIVTAFVAVAIALLVCRVVFGSPLQLFIPRGLELWQALVGSLIGGLAGHELAIDLRRIGGYRDDRSERSAGTPVESVLALSGGQGYDKGCHQN